MGGLDGLGSDGMQGPREEESRIIPGSGISLR